MLNEANRIKGNPIKGTDRTVINSESRNKKAYIDSKFPDATKDQLAFLYELAGVSKTVGHYRPQFE